ncbi:MAG: preprotein translocase subunit YajC [Rikenellaceae bacterium]
MFNLLNASVDTGLTIQTDAPTTTTTVVETEAIGDAPTAPWTEQIGPFILPILMVAFVWFIMIRPENKRRKEMNKFRESIKKGDKVVTAGGIYAIVKEVKENTLLIEVDSNVTLRIDKNMVVADSSALQTK